jgi:Holliday junction resolvase RusA-like endonuclease
MTTTLDEQMTVFGFGSLHKPACRIVMPLAPTVNNYRSVCRNRLMTTVEGLEYHAAVAKRWHAYWGERGPIEGRLRLLVRVHMARNGDADLDNRIKALQDALADAGAFENDCHIDDLRVIRGCVMPPTGAMDVIIQQLKAIQ